MSNATCNRHESAGLRIGAMHEQMQRLYTAAKDLKGISGQSEVARAMNVSPQAVNNWETRGVSRPGMLAAERAFGCSAIWIETGEGDMQHPRVAEPIAPYGPGESKLPIRFALFKISAGVSGYEIEYENGESEPIFMGRRWFEENHYRPDRLLAVRVNGRSMEPNLHDGDLVVINTDDTTPKDGVVFAANYDGELVIKRMKREAGQWFLASDSPDKARFGDKVCQDGCDLIGRIVYKQSEHI